MLELERQGASSLVEEATRRLARPVIDARLAGAVPVDVGHVVALERRPDVVVGSLGISQVVEVQRSIVPGATASTRDGAGTEGRRQKALHVKNLRDFVPKRRGPCFKKFANRLRVIVTR